jgi:hypothetical protein
LRRLDRRSPERRGKSCERAQNAVAKAEQIEWPILQGKSGRERELGSEFFLRNRMQTIDKVRKIAISGFDPAKADAATRWNGAASSWKD